MADFITLTSSDESLMDIKSGVKKPTKITVNINNIESIYEDPNGSRIYTISPHKEPIRVFESTDQILNFIDLIEKEKRSYQLDRKHPPFPCPG